MEMENLRSKDDSIKVWDMEQEKWFTKVKTRMKEAEIRIKKRLQWLLDSSRSQENKIICSKTTH